MTYALTAKLKTEQINDNTLKVMPSSHRLSVLAVAKFFNHEQNCDGKCISKRVSNNYGRCGVHVVVLGGPGMSCCLARLPAIIAATCFTASVIGSTDRFFCPDEYSHAPSAIERKNCQNEFHGIWLLPAV